MPRKPDPLATESIPLEQIGGHVHGPDCHHEPVQAPVRRDTPKLGRNDPCSCGSGKKFKKCHGLTT